MTTPDVAAGEGSRAEDEVEDGGQGESFLGGLEHFLHILPAMITLGVIVVIVLTVVQVFHSPIFKQLGDALGDLANALTNLLSSPFFYPVLISYLLLPVLGPVLVSLISTRNRSRWCGSDESEAQVKNRFDFSNAVNLYWYSRMIKPGVLLQAKLYAEQDGKQNTYFLDQLTHIGNVASTNNADAFVKEFQKNASTRDPGYGASLLDAVAEIQRRSAMVNGEGTGDLDVRLSQIYLSTRDTIEPFNVDAFNKWKDSDSLYDDFKKLLTESKFSADEADGVVSQLKKGYQLDKIIKVRRIKEKLEALHDRSLKGGGEGAPYLREAPSFLAAIYPGKAMSVASELDADNQYSAKYLGDEAHGLFWDTIAEVTKTAHTFKTQAGPTNEAYNRILIRSDNGDKKMVTVPFDSDGQFDKKTFEESLSALYKPGEVQRIMDDLIDGDGKVVGNMSLDKSIRKIIDRARVLRTETHPDLFDDSTTFPDDSAGYTPTERSAAIRHVRDVVDEAIQRVKEGLMGRIAEPFKPKNCGLLSMDEAERIIGIPKGKVIQPSEEYIALQELLADGSTRNLKTFAEKCPTLFEAAIGMLGDNNQVHMTTDGKGRFSAERIANSPTEGKLERMRGEALEKQLIKLKQHETKETAYKVYPHLTQDSSINAMKEDAMFRQVRNDKFNASSTAMKAEWSEKAPPRARNDSHTKNAIRIIDEEREHTRKELQQPRIHID